MTGFRLGPMLILLALLSFLDDSRFVAAQVFEDRPTFAFRVGFNGQIDSLETKFRNYKLLSPHVSVALSSTTQNRFGLSDETKKKINDVATQYDKVTALIPIMSSGTLDLEKFRERKSHGETLELIIRDCLSEKQLEECKAIHSMYVYYDSGPVYWAQSIGASQSEQDDVMVSASNAAESLRLELLAIEKEATSKLLACLLPNVVTDINNLLRPEGVTLHPTPTLLYDSLASQGYFADANDKKITRVPAFKLSEICTFEATDTFAFRNRYEQNLEVLMRSYQSLPEFNAAQWDAISSSYVSLQFSKRKATKEEDLLIYQAEFEKAVEALSPNQQLEFKRRQMMGRIKREGIIQSLSTPNASELRPSLRLDSKEVQKLKDSKAEVAKYIKERMEIVQKKYIDLILADLPSKLKSKVIWEGTLTTKQVPPLELLLFHCERYE